MITQLSYKEQARRKWNPPGLNLQSSSETDKKDNKETQAWKTTITRQVLYGNQKCVKKCSVFWWIESYYS